MANTTGAITSTEGGTGATSNTVTVVVVAPPTILKVFGAPSIPLNGSTSLSFTVHNPNAGTPLTGVGFSDMLPAGLVISTPNGLAGSCGGGTITATQNTSVISLSGASLGASASCGFSVSVTGTAAGTKNNTTGNVSSTEGGTGGVALASLIVTGADVGVMLTHHPDPAPIGGRLIFVATVTNNGPASANVAFSEAFLGAQYVVTATPSQGSPCSTTEPVSCNLGLMNSGASATVTIVVTPLLGRNVTATATATPDLSDPDLTNNTASDTGRIRFKPQRF
jgi:hypothetical protein